MNVVSVNLVSHDDVAGVIGKLVNAVMVVVYCRIVPVLKVANVVVFDDYVRYRRAGSAGSEFDSVVRIVDGVVLEGHVGDDRSTRIIGTDTVFGIVDGAVLNEQI